MSGTNIGVVKEDTRSLAHRITVLLSGLRWVPCSFRGEKRALVGGFRG